MLPALTFAPLDSPLVVTGGFGEFRIGHFHAGLDFSTQGRVGRPVLAPLDGWIERVRASGVGYGRSVYLHADDGRLLVFGHLDAYAKPVARYVAFQQDSSGQYEQDLWPAPGKFRVRAGESIAWSGQSGAGGPHLHFEIRVVDMAYNPLRSGLAIADRSPPSLPSLTLEPLDAESRVAGGLAPWTIALGARPETLDVLGQVRAIVGARDGAWSGVDRMMPWSVRAESENQFVECRFDSISWATDMSQSDYVYDIGRVRGEKDVVLWAPPRFRPRTLVTSLPDSVEAGTWVVLPGALRTLRLTAEDANGNRVTRAVVLRGGSPQNGAEAPPPTASKKVAPAIAVTHYAALPGGWLRLTLSGADRMRQPVVRLGSERAVVTTRRGVLTALLRPDASPGAPLLVEGLAAPDSGGARGLWRGPILRVSHADDGGADSLAGVSWRIPPGGLFEPAVFVAEALEKVAGNAELKPAGPAVAIHPDDHPLRRALTYRATLARGEAPRGVGLYQDRGDGWEFVRTRFDSTGGFFEGDSRGLGRLALLRDTVAPRLGPRRSPRRAPPAPYNRWALETAIDERGSGVEARSSYYRIDGRRVATEWDSDAKTLRWRPLEPPRKGRHRYQLIVADRAGNVARAIGTFVLN